MSRRRGDAPELIALAVLESYLSGGHPSFESNQAVAEVLDINVQKVFYLLRQAYDQGLFSINIHLDADEKDRLQLEVAIRQQFAQNGLKRVLLVPPPHGSPVTACEMGTRLIASRVVDHVHEVFHRLGKSEPIRIGLGRGPRVRSVIDELFMRRDRPEMSNLTVWPIIGATGGLDPLRYDAPALVSDTAAAWAATMGQLAAPGFVWCTKRDLVEGMNSTRMPIGELHQCDVVVAAVEPLKPMARNVPDAMLALDHVLADHIAGSALRRGAVGHVSSFLFDHLGAPVDTQWDPVGLGLDGLRALVQSGKSDVVLMATDAAAAAPLRAVLSAGLATTLVTDMNVAHQLVPWPKPKKSDA